MTDQIAESEPPKPVMAQLAEFFSDRIQLNSVLIVLCFVSVLLLESQSAASWPTYLLAIAMLVTFREWNDVFRQKMLWVIMVLLGWLCLSAFWSEPFEWRDVFTVFTRALLIFFFVVAFAECQLRGQLRRWLGRALAVVGLLAVGAALWVHFQDPPAHGRLNGLGQLDTQVIAALVYGVVLIFVLDVVLTDRSLRWRVVAGVSAVVVAYAVYLSDSRNAWVSVSIGAVVLGLGHLLNSSGRFATSVGALALFALAAIVGLIMGDVAEELVLPRGFSYRPEIWQAAIARTIEGSIWVGLGINTPDDFVLRGEAFHHTHNMYLSILYQGGLVAIALLALLLAMAGKTLFRNYGHLNAKLGIAIFALALAAYLLDGHELIDKVGATWLLFWLPVSIALGFNWSQPALFSRHRGVPARRPSRDGEGREAL